MKLPRMVSACFYRLVLALASGLVSTAWATTFTVTTNADSGVGSLRQAIIDSNTAGGTNTIALNASLGTITLASDLPAVQSDVTFTGNNNTLDGASTYRGFFIGKFSGSAQVAVAVTIQDLTITHTVARGGEGKNTGGGGAGLGGALFVAANASLTLSNVVLEAAVAAGGSTTIVIPVGGGGGGMGGDGAIAVGHGGGGAGGFGSGALGGAGAYLPGAGGPGAPGIAVGAASGGSGAGTGGAGGINGGGGGGGANAFPHGGGGGGGGVGGVNSGNNAGGAGGFGGGGGGGAFAATGTGGPGGFGGGGGGGGGEGGGSGGFGGGAGGAYTSDGGLAGFGGGAGGLAVGLAGGGPGGGAGLGGAIFVQEGGALTVAGPLTISGNTVVGGLGAQGTSGFGTPGGNGLARGAGIFLQGSDGAHGGTGALTFSPASGTVTVSDVIGDQNGNGGGGSWSLVKTGSGALILSANNTYTGATTVSGGTLKVNNVPVGGTDSGVGSGDVTVATGGTLGGSGQISGAVTVQSGGAVAPGNSIGTLTIQGDFLWNAGGTMQFELSNSSNASDRVVGIENFNKGGSGVFLFDFQGTGTTATYTLFTWNSSTTFSAGDFTYTNLAPGLSGVFYFVGNALTFRVTPSLVPPPLLVSTPFIIGVGVPADGRYTAGANLDFAMTFNQDVAVNGAGTAAVQLQVGSAVRNALYLSGNGGATLVFRYTVQAADAAPNGIRLVSPGIGNGAVIQGVAGLQGGSLANLASFSFPVPNTSGIVVGLAPPLPPPAPLAATVTLGNLNQTYTGAPLSASATTMPAGLAVSLTYGGSSTPPTNAGSYAVEATVTSPGYAGSASGTLVIGQAQQTISWVPFVSPLPSTAGPLPLLATATSGLPVTFARLSGPATLSGSTLTLAGVPGVVNVQASQAGNANYLAAATATASLNVAAASPLVNASTLGPVGGGNVLLVGFVVRGAGSKTLLLRAAGPALAGLGLAGTLAAPTLQLFDGTGAVVTSNSGWNGASNLSALFSQVGAFPFATGSTDAATSVTLQPGAYTLMVRASGGASGIALAEVYDAGVNLGTPSPPNASTTALSNISTRAQVAPGAPIVVGFVIGGTEPKQLLIRGLGPALKAFGITGTLTDPFLAVLDRTDHGLTSNSNWDNHEGEINTPVSAAQIPAATATVGAFPLTPGSSDSAVLVTLPPGLYFAKVFSFDGSSGAAMLEIYEVP